MAPVDFFKNLAVLSARRPGLAIGTGAAVLAAPVFMKNDNRGYFKTSTMTTPALVAAAMVAPQLVSTTYGQGKHLVDVIRQVPTDYGFRDGVYGKATDAANIAEEERAYASGRGSINEHLKAQGNFYSNLPVEEVTSNQVEREWGSLTSNFNRLYQDPTKHRLLENALFHAQLQQSGAVDKLGWEGLTSVAPAMTLNEIDDVMAANSKNIDWIREMNFRLREASEAKVASTEEAIASLADLPEAGSAETLMSASYEGTGAKALKRLHPDLANELDAVLSDPDVVAKFGYKAENIEVFGIPGRNKAFNQIVGLRINGDLTIPIVDANGGVRLGSSFENLGVSRFFMTHDKKISADMYSILGLREGPKFVKNEQGRAQWVVGRDPHSDNPFQAAESGIAQATPGQQRFYSKQGVFANARGSFKDGAWDSLRPEDRVDEIAYQVEHNGMIRTTGGTSNDYLEMAETALIEPGGVHNYSKESLRIKSLNKAIWADVAEGHGGYSATDWADLPEFGARSLQITPSQRALFGDLPEWEQLISAGFDSGLAQDAAARARTLSMDLAMSKIGAKSRAIGYIAKDAGIDEIQAANVWDSLLPLLSNRKNYDAVRNIGYLGDGARIMKAEAGARARRRMNYLVDDPMLSKGIVAGERFGPNQVLGAERGVLKFAQGQGDSGNQLIRATKMQDGKVLYEVDEIFGIQGTKVHNLGKQTVSRALEDWGNGDGEMNRITRVFNKYFKESGQGGEVADDVTSVVMQQYNTDGANNALQALNDQVGGLFSELEGISEDGKLPAFLSEKQGAAASYLDRLAEFGYSYENGKLITKTAKLANGDAGRAEYASAAEVIRSLFDDVGTRIRNHEITGNRFMTSYIDWSLKHEGGSFLDYTMQRGLYESMSISDHLALNHASRVGITRDSIQQLGLAGEHDIAREILARSTTDGLTGKTIDFMAYTDVGDYSKQFGSRAIELADATGSQPLSGLSRASDRTMKVNGDLVSNIFDPTNPLTQDNYSIRANVGGKDYFIPVLGREAYGGKANPHDLNEYSANKWENELNDTLQAARDVNEGFPGVAFDKTFDTYVQKVRQSYGVGKESAWRAPNVDPFGYEGRATARSSRMRYANGDINPFEVGVGEEYLNLMNKDEADLLRQGGSLQAINIRQPVNAVVQAHVKYDPNLNGPWQIGGDPVMVRMMREDFDGDRVAFHLVNTDAASGPWANPKNEMVFGPLPEKQAAAYARWQEFENKVNDPTSLQARMKDFRQVFEGNEADPRNYVKGAFTDMFSKDGAIQKFINKPLLKSIKARTAAADVGMLSNTFDLFETSMAHNDLFRDPFEKLVTHEFGYDIIREASIAAQKLKEGRAYQDLTSLMAWNNRLRTSLAGGKSGKGRNLNAFLDTMSEGAQNFGRTVPVNDAHRAIFNITAEHEAKGINPYYEFSKQKYGRDLLTKEWEGYDSGVTELQRILSVNRENAAEYTRKPIVSVFNNKVPASRAFAERGSSAADAAAAALGAENAGIAADAGKFAGKAGAAAEGVANQVARSVAEVAKSARGTGAMKVLGIGAAVAAGAGLLFGSLRSPRKGQALAPSGSRFRPEEKIGTDGGIPGEPETGAMAPANPPRRVRPARGNVRTAVVAPIGRSTELEVHLKAEDRGQAAEASKLAARFAAPAGNSHVSITYRDTTRLDSLRTKERIREAMDER